MDARVGISLIGTPDGFESASLGASKSVNIGRKVDLDNSVINILPDTDILAVRRDVEGERLLTYVIYYRFAREIKTSRTGSFYGCSMLFENFVPDKVSFIFQMLETLAERLGDSCINKSENRFHSHITPALLEGFAADKSLLEPSTYTDDGDSQLGRIHDGRCFLLINSDVPDYVSFLSAALLHDPQAPSGLPSYHFAYTSRHAAVLEQARLRRGLKVETLASLREKYTGDGPSREVARQIRPRHAGGEVLPDAPSAAETHVSDLQVSGSQSPASADDLKGDGPEESGETERSPTREESAEEVTAGRLSVASAVRRRVRIEVPVAYRPLPHASARESRMADGYLVSLARFIERLFRLRASGWDSSRLRFGKTGVLVPALAVAGILVLGAYLLKTTWSVISGRQPKTVYYYGCVNEAKKTIGAVRECQPDVLADKFLTRLNNCGQYTSHLTQLNREQPRGGDKYSNDLKEAIMNSLASRQPNGLSISTAASFDIKLDFDGSDICLDGFLKGNDPEFSYTPPPSTPTPTPKPSPTQPQSEGGNAPASSSPPSNARPKSNKNENTVGNTNNANANSRNDNNKVGNQNANGDRNGNGNQNLNSGQTSNKPQTTPESGNSNAPRPTATPAGNKKQAEPTSGNQTTPQPGAKPEDARPDKNHPQKRLTKKGPDGDKE